MEYSFRDEIMYIYNVTDESLHKITFPPEITELRINGDYLDHFDIPPGIISVHIESMGLKSIILPDSIECLYCSRNFLRTIELPKGMRVLEARHNLLDNITGNTIGLEHIDIRSNRFKSLNFELGNNLEYFNASFNDIEYTSPRIKSFLQNQDIPRSPRPHTPDDLDSDFRYSWII